MVNYRRNFTKGGMYFFTLVLQDRSKDYLMRYIDKFRFAYKETQKHYPFETVAICILPDHLHLIMQLPENDDNYSIRIAFLKTQFTKILPLHCRNPNDSQNKRRETGIWQRRFWEHLIKDDKDLSNHIDYIYYNPVKHGYVKNVSDWQFSSFHRDVRNGMYPMDWGNNVDITVLNLYKE